MIKANVDILSSAEKVKNRLADEISLEIYNARVRYAVYRDAFVFYEDIFNICSNVEWRIPELNELFALNPETDGIVIFGSGKVGKYVLRLLLLSKYKDYKILFCDNDASIWGSSVCGYKIISPHELNKNYRNSIVVVGSELYRAQIYEQLCFEGFPRQKILYPRLGKLYGQIGYQYFDFFHPEKNEIFVDAGCFDGDTACDFAKWTNGEYEKIYAFEANPYCMERCEQTFNKKHIDNVSMIKKGLWDKKGIVRFRSNYSGGACISENGNVEIQVDSLDNVLNGRRVSFIKMDIEKSEYRALIGAKNTIETYHPRLAICVYHKPEDIFQIPELLLRYYSEYKFALRQYQSNGSSTILYAWSD